MVDTVASFLNYLEVEKGFSANTLVAYKNDLNQLLQFLNTSKGSSNDGNQWQQVDRSMLSRYIVSLRQRDYALSTVARKVAAVKSFFDYLTEEGLVKADPTE